MESNGTPHLVANARRVFDALTAPETGGLVRSYEQLLEAAELPELDFRAALAYLEHRSLLSRTGNLCAITSLGIRAFMSAEMLESILPSQPRAVAASATTAVTLATAASAH